MKIAFITSCLEPGRDGVGDYTSLLAAECAALGNEVCLLALNDPFCGSEKAAVENASLRLGAGMSWGQRIEQARIFLDAFAPDFVSIQFVCYGFHPRGLDWSLAARLKKITGARPVQMMLHELWIGTETGARWKDRLVGAIQRRGVLGLLRALNPRLVQTSNSAYVHLLRQQGVRAARLPLFGHLPLPPSAEKRADGGLTFAFFGTLHLCWPAEPFLTQLRGLGAPVTLAHAGRIGGGAELWERLARDYSTAFTFRKLGELPPENVAEFLAAADFGVATTPWALIGKSGSVAAMLDCGLPVVVNRDDVHYPGFTDIAPPDQLLLKMSADLPAQLRAARRRPPRLLRPEVAAQFLAACKGAFAK